MKSGSARGRSLAPELTRPLLLPHRTSSSLLWRGPGRESGASRSRPPPGCAKTWSPSPPRLWSCTRWSGRRPAPPSRWWDRTLSTCRRRSEEEGRGRRPGFTSTTSLVSERDPGWMKQREIPESMSSKQEGKMLNVASLCGR